MKRIHKVKNAILFSSFLIGQIPVLFFGMSERLNLSILVERSTRIDFFTMYYANSIGFVILSYMVAYPKGVDARVARFILIVCYLDFLHLLLFAKQGFGMSKVGFAMAIYFTYGIIKKRWRN